MEISEARAYIFPREASRRPLLVQVFQDIPQAGGVEWDFSEFGTECDPVAVSLLSSCYISLYPVLVENHVSERGENSWKITDITLTNENNIIIK